ncbi:hypothetical protein T05_11268 [Trichinella murrelli]|uniref:Uncharacterized protein n=1 Tax=Trichinella murrelli TaxID=144512 RepID=A0A0V0UGC9_9BILA|nr:hypothetical protein T05_11268 [Trichinella murrelli]
MKLTNSNCGSHLVQWLVNRGLNFQACFNSVLHITFFLVLLRSRAPIYIIAKWYKLMPFSGLSKRIALK